MAEHDTGAPWSLPYPDLDEVADPPADIQQLAEAVAAKLTQMKTDFVPPVGSLFMWAAAAAPAHYLLCDGASKLRADFADLFAAIGSTYGVVDGTHFNVPDLRGRTPVGVDTSHLRIVALHGNQVDLGEVGGESDHVTTTGELPSHNHGLLVDGNGAVMAVASGGNPAFYDRPAGAILTGITHTANSGGGSAHQNMQPYQILNFIIRYE